jgi:RNA polymerase sigma factor (sigma-70 family)
MQQEPRPPDDSAADCERWLAENDRFVHHVVASVARRRRLSREDADELRSLVSLKLVGDEYRVLRAFKGRSTLRTYLTVVVTRVCLDFLIARRGKWRPSAAARRGGATAMRLEKLIARDGWSFDQACEVLRINEQVAATPRELEDIAATLPVRERPRLVGMDALEFLAPSVPAIDDERSEAELVRARVQETLALVLEELTPDDRLLIQLRFTENLSVAQIARALHGDQKALYRQFNRILRDLKARFASRTRPGSDRAFTSV